MSWNSHHELDPVEDVVTAHFQGVVLNTPEDAERWFQETKAQLEQYGRKVDLLIDLDGLVVRFGAARTFGLRRAEILQRFAKHSIRYGGDSLTHALIFTTAVRENTHGDVFDSREEALNALHALRAAEKAAK